MNWYAAERLAMERQSFLLNEAKYLRRAGVAKRVTAGSAAGTARFAAIRVVGFALAQAFRARNPAP